VAPFAFGAIAAGAAALLVYTQVEETLGRVGQGGELVSDAAEAVD